MKILFLANHFNTGGITTYILTLAREYIARGHQVFVVTSGGDALAEAQGMGVCHLMVASLRVKCAFHPGLLPAAFKVALFARKQRIDIIHAQTRVTQVVAGAVAMALGKAFVSTCHGFFKPRWARRLFPAWGRAVIAVSRPVADHLKQDLHVDERLISFVPNGIDAQKFKPYALPERMALRASYGLVGGQAVVGIIARLSDVKGHACLIDAMQQLVRRFPGVRCMIFGEGPLEAALKVKVKTMGLEGTIYFYRVNGRPQDLLPMFDVFALPSLQEGLGLSVLEAQACGVAVAASRVGGLVDAVDDGHTGILVPAGDAQALADAIARILDDASLAARFSTNARHFIKAMFSSEKMAEATLNVYRKAMVHA